MNRSRLVFITLFLLMLLLVLSAAFVFLFQGRQQIEQRMRDAESTLAQTQQELDVTIGVLEESTQAFATAEAISVLLEEDLVQSQQEADRMVATAEALQAENRAVNAELANYLGQAPSIEILVPAEGAEVVVDQPVDYSFVVADGVGVTAVLVTVNDEVIEASSLVELPIAYIDGTWTPEVVGPVVMGFQASNQRTSILVTRTLTVTVPAAPLTPQGGGASQFGSESIEAAVSQIRGLRPVMTGTLPVLSKQSAGIDQPPPLFPPTPNGPTERVWSLFDFTAQETFAPGSEAFAYVPDENVYATGFVGQDGAALLPYDYAGAFALLLIDQNFGWLSRERVSNDAWLAQYGFAEGDVSLVQDAIVETALFEDLDPDQLEQSPANNLSALLREAGRAFVQALLDVGGYAAVDEAWRTRPRSTEQLLHPEKYTNGELPIGVELPDLLPALGESWSLLQEATFGEALLRVYLSRHLNETQVDTAATGWGGDGFAVYQSGEANVLVYKIVWDSAEDATEFAALYPTYPTRLFTASGELQPGGECWRGDEVICLYQNELETWIVRAPDLETAVGLAAFLDEP